MSGAAALRHGLDFAVEAEFVAETVDELVDLFRDRASSRGADGQRIRLCGRATQQHALPAPGSAGPVVLARLDRLDRITRFEPGDLTCSVEPGVRIAELAAAAAEHGLRLPCPTPLADAPNDDATVGGLFAAGRSTPRAPGQLGARGVLLGLTGVRPDGQRFRAGARVVKSVAGFDIPKLFVGSRGRLFAATELHLKLRPLPRAAADFVRMGLDRAAAIALWRAVRTDRDPPASVVLTGSEDAGFAVHGRFEGHPTTVDAALSRHDLQAAAAVEAPILADDRPRLTISLRPSRVATLLERLPTGATAICDGVGGARIATPTDGIAPLLATVAELAGAAEQETGPVADRGRATTSDPGAARIAARLHQSFDPDAVLV